MEHGYNKNGKYGDGQSKCVMQNPTDATKQDGCSRKQKLKLPRKTRTDILEHSDKCIIDLCSSPSPSTSHRALKFQMSTVEKPMEENIKDRSRKAPSMHHRRAFPSSYPNESVRGAKDTLPSLIRNDSKTEKVSQGSLKIGVFPSNNRNNTSGMCGYSSKGKEKIEYSSVPLEACMTDSDKMWEVNNRVSNRQTCANFAPKDTAPASKPLQIFESPKRGPPKFVRNGLISPQSIAEGKKIVGQNSNRRDAEQDNKGKAVCIDPWTVIDISESSVEGKAINVRKEKGGKTRLQMPNNADTGDQSLNERDTVIYTEDHNVLRGTSKEVGNIRCSQNRKAHHQNGIAIPLLNKHSNLTPQIYNMETEPSRGFKRRRDASSSTRQQRKNQGSSHVNNSDRSNSADMDANKRQLEVDERVARELQEQLYQEEAPFNDIEMDANIAMSLFQDEQVEQAFIAGTRPASNRGALMAHRMPRQPRLRPSQPTSRRRVARSRLFGLSRGTQPRRGVRISTSSDLHGPFPFDMPVDTRLDILEAWEAASDDVSGLGIFNTLLQAGHEFDENNYESLLALDENNHERGASAHQINSLPVSTVQVNNIEDNCAVCLETPSLGETIRHLPCFHKFHKECIDQWLGRKTWCPICKSSVTQS